MAASSRYVTVVRNISGATRFFGYLPPFGVTLADRDDVEVKGDLLALLSAPNKKTELDAYLADIAADRIVVVQSPTPSYYDATTTRVRELTIANGVVTVSDPEAGSYGGPAPVQ